MFCLFVCLFLLLFPVPQSIPSFNQTSSILTTQFEFRILKVSSSPGVNFFFHFLFSSFFIFFSSFFFLPEFVGLPSEENPCERQEQEPESLREAGQLFAAAQMSSNNFEENLLHHPEDEGSIYSFVTTGNPSSQRPQIPSNVSQVPQWPHYSLSHEGGPHSEDVGFLPPQSHHNPPQLHTQFGYGSVGADSFRLLQPSSVAWGSPHEALPFLPRSMSSEQFDLLSPFMPLSFSSQFSVQQPQQQHLRQPPNFDFSSLTSNISSSSSSSSSSASTSTVCLPSFSVPASQVKVMPRDTASHDRPTHDGRSLFGSLSSPRQGLADAALTSQPYFPPTSSPVASRKRSLSEVSLPQLSPLPKKVQMLLQSPPSTAYSVSAASSSSSSYVERKCINCSTEETPLWRQNDQGDSLCNACGLYYKHHGAMRPTKLSQNPNAPKKKWKVPRDGPMLCHNCQTVTTPIWRRGTQGELLCNACGLHLRIHKTHRPKDIASLELKKALSPKIPPKPMSSASSSQESPRGFEQGFHLHPLHLQRLQLSQLQAGSYDDLKYEVSEESLGSRHDDDPDGGDSEGSGHI